MVLTVLFLKNYGKIVIMKNFLKGLLSRDLIRFAEDTKDCDLSNIKITKRGGVYREKNMRHKHKQEFPFNMIPYFFGFIAFVIIVTIAVQSWFAYEVVNAIKTDGVKGAVENVWCGSSNSEECKESIRKTLEEGLK